MAFCSQCGTEKPDSGICPSCNAASAAPPPPPPPPTAPPPPPVPPPPPPPPPSVEQQQQWQQQPPYQSQYQQPPIGQQKAPQGFVGDVFSKSFGFLFKKPVLLWGLSLLCSLMAGLAIIFGIVPLVWLPVLFVLQVGMANIFLCGYRGQEISSNQLFEGFGKGKFVRNAAGMGWRYLWTLIWGLVPIMGYVKFYAYRFVPYIMITNPDISANEALRKSMRQTNGYKGKMFLTDLIIYAALAGVVLVFALLIYLFSQLHYIIGGLFILIGVLVYIAVTMLLPLFLGTIEAVYYDKISKKNPED